MSTTTLLHLQILVLYIIIIARVSSWHENKFMVSSTWTWKPCLLILWLTCKVVYYRCDSMSSCLFEYIILLMFSIHFSFIVPLPDPDSIYCTPTVWKHIRVQSDPSPNHRLFVTTCTSNICKQQWLSITNFCNNRTTSNSEPSHAGQGTPSPYTQAIATRRRFKRTYTAKANINHPSTSNHQLTHQIQNAVTTDTTLSPHYQLPDLTISPFLNTVHGTAIPRSAQSAFRYS